MSAQAEHTNHDTQKKVNHVLHKATSSKVGKRVKRTAKKITKGARQLEQRASSALEEGEGRFTATARNVARWARQNPKAAIGAVVGAGIVLGVLGNSRFGRAAMIGLSGLAVSLIRRVA